MEAHPDPTTAPAADDPEHATFLADIIAGLSLRQKSLPSKYFYDERGSALFDHICELEEYYVTRTEMAIMQRHAAEMAQRLGPGCLLIEYGSGSSTKTYPLLDSLPRPAAYAPVDVSREHLLRTAERVARDYPDLTVTPVVADFTSDFPVPDAPGSTRRAVYFPGSTIGNLIREDAVRLLRRIARVCGPGGVLLVGVDLQKPVEVLERAYNDASGVTAAFNLNLLQRINRELGADFDLRRFRHRAVWNEDASRIEMHLESLTDQAVQVGGESFTFDRGETILTEYSHKYTLEGFREVAGSAGFLPAAVWTDPRQWFSVHYLEVSRS